MRRLAALTIVLLAVLAAGAYGVLAWADSRSAANMASGTRIAGVDVSGLTREEALARLERRVGAGVGRPAQVTVDGRTYTLTAQQAGIRVDLRGAVDRAFSAGRSDSMPMRGWRELTGGKVDHAETAPVTVDRAAIRSFVGGIHRDLARAPVDASLDIQLDRVSITPERLGRRLMGRDALVDRLAAAMVRRGPGSRVFTAKLATVAPRMTADSIFDAQPVAVTVSREGKTVRVFERGKLARTYRVAVGEPKYPTPTGQFSVQTMQKDPPWNVPHSEWAGDLAGKTIPGGDPKNPLVARWIGFDGSVGFHGTKSIDSLGRAASHGCVRMNPGDVTDLYERVRAGTPVLVA
jgi:lipoprotein-anchoring transpeptidase ErfK/SrfK